MGVKNLMKLIRTKFPSAIYQTHISTYVRKRVLLDVSNYIYKYKAIYGDRFLTAFLNLIKLFYRFNVHCCFIFDGQAPLEKLKTLCERKKHKQTQKARIDNLKTSIELYEQNPEKVPQSLLQFVDNPFGCINTEELKEKLTKMERENIHILPDDILSLKQLITLTGSKYIEAPTETEPLCGAIQVNSNYAVQTVFSEDSDLLVYGIKELIIKCDSNGNCSVVSLDKLLELMEFTHEQFIDFCIMCGTDYNDNILGIGPINSYNLIKQHLTIENYEKTSGKSPIGYKRTRELMRPYETTDISKLKIEYWDVSINKDELLNFLFEHNIVDYEIEDLFKPTKIEFV